MNRGSTDRQNILHLDELRLDIHFPAPVERNVSGPVLTCFIYFFLIIFAVRNSRLSFSIDFFYSSALLGKVGAKPQSVTED